MDSGLVGFVGVIAGSLTTGGVQLLVEQRNRRNDALSAAQLIYGALADADAILAAAAHANTWVNVGRQPRLFDRHIAVWEGQRQTLARMARFLDFHLIGAAFAALSSIDELFEQATAKRVPDRGLSAVLSDPHHKLREKLLTEALAASERAGRRPSDRIFSRRREKRLKKRLGENWERFSNLDIGADGTR